MLHFQTRFQMFRKKIKKNIFLFGIIASKLAALKFSLLRREYLSSSFNVSRNSVNIWHITNRDFLQLNCIDSDHKYGKAAAVEISTIFGPV